MFEGDIVQPTAGTPEEPLPDDGEIETRAETEFSNREVGSRAESLVQLCGSDEDAQRFVRTVDVMVDVAFIERHRPRAFPSQRGGVQGPVDRSFIHDAGS